MQSCVLRVLYTSSVLFLCLKEGARATNRVGRVHSVEGRFVPMGGVGLECRWVRCRGRNVFNRDVLEKDKEGEFTIDYRCGS